MSKIVSESRLQSYGKKITYTAYKCIQSGKCMHPLKRNSLKNKDIKKARNRAVLKNVCTFVCSATYVLGLKTQLQFYECLSDALKKTYCAWQKADCISFAMSEEELRQSPEPSQ